MEVIGRVILTYRKFFCYHGHFLPLFTMCGILAVHGLEKPSNDRAHFIALSKRQRHRGPDWSGCYVGQKSILVHERLAIVGVG
jgi:hypothetical protein